MFGIKTIKGKAILHDINIGNLFERQKELEFKISFLLSNPPEYQVGDSIDGATVMCVSLDVQCSFNKLHGKYIYIMDKELPSLRHPDYRVKYTEDTILQHLKSRPDIKIIKTKK